MSERLPVEPGIYPKMPMDIYHASDGISWSVLSKARVSCEHFYEAYASYGVEGEGGGSDEGEDDGGSEESSSESASKIPTPKEQEKKLHQLIGTGFHTPALEPHLFQPFIWRGGDRRSKEAKAKYAIMAAEAEAAKQLVLTPAQYEQIQRMMAKLQSHPIAAPMLYDCAGMNECSLFANDEETGLFIKARPDRLIYMDDGSFTLVDIKTTANIGFGAFDNEVKRWGYHQQMAMFAAVIKAATGRSVSQTRMVIVEKAPPYAVAVRDIGFKELAEGENKVRELLLRVKQWQNTQQTCAFPELGTIMFSW